MLLVVDTNILVNALKSNQSGAKSYQLLKDVMAGKHFMCVSSDIMAEYEDVLHRPQLKLNAHLVDMLLSWIYLHAIWIEPQPTTPDEIRMGDEDDRVFYDVARCLKAKLVTRNYRDYPVDELITLVDELY